MSALRRRKYTRWEPPLGNPPFVQISKPALLKIARSVHGSVQLAVLCLAADRSNGIGHAEFRQGELVREVRTLLRKQTDPATVSAAIAALKSAEILHPDSGAGCLVLYGDVLQFGSRDDWCRGPGTGDKTWLPGSPEAKQPTTRVLVGEDEAATVFNRDGEVTREVYGSAYPRTLAESLDEEPLGSASRREAPDDLAPF